MVVKWVNVDGVDTFNNGFIRIYWSSNIGFGQYDLWCDPDSNEKKWKADSECLDSNEDKEFLKALLEKFVEEVEIVS